MGLEKKKEEWLMERDEYITNTINYKRFIDYSIYRLSIIIGDMFHKQRERKKGFISPRMFKKESLGISTTKEFFMGFIQEHGEHELFEPI